MQIIKRIAQHLKNIIQHNKSEDNTHLVWGFTLVEAVVVVGIAAILSSILIVYTRQGEKQVVFFKEQSLLVNSILRAKAFSIATFQPTLQPNQNEDRICGWGVHFHKNSSSYLIFKDLAPGNSDCAAGANRKYNRGLGLDEEFEKFSLPVAVKIECIALFDIPNQVCANSANQLNDGDVIFTPPDPTVFFFPSNASDKELVVNLALDDGSRKTEIRINSFGQISFQ